MGKSRAGSGGLALILVVALLVLGGWNYHRNYQLEQAQRSGASMSRYDTASLIQLMEAYRLEVATLAGERQKLLAARPKVRRTAGVGAGVREFERIQRSADQLRDATGALSSREARLREIEAELATRKRAASGFALHLERLTGLERPI